MKPANIMLDEDQRVVLTDFGRAKAVQGSSQLTGTGIIVGTPHFMAPEQARGGEIDGRADQYALAAVAHQMLAGELLFDGDSMHAILYKHILEPPPSLATVRADLPADLCAAIERALAKDPAARFASMEQFAAAVSGEATGASSSPTIVQRAADPPSAVRASVPRRPVASASHRTRYLAAGAAAAALAIAGWGSSRSPPRTRAAIANPSSAGRSDPGRSDADRSSTDAGRT